MYGEFSVISSVVANCSLTAVVMVATTQSTSAMTALILLISFPLSKFFIHFGIDTLRLFPGLAEVVLEGLH